MKFYGQCWLHPTTNSKIYFSCTEVALLKPELVILASTIAHGEKQLSPWGNASCLESEMNHPAQT